MHEETRRELEQIKSQLNALALRVRELERKVALESAPRAEATLRLSPPVSPPPSVSPAASTPVRESPSGLPSLERALGGKVALYTGITLLFLATAFFLGWAWQRLTPEGRLALGYLSGFVLMALGVLARQRTEQWFTDGLIGAGLATLYLTTWAGWERYQLLGFAPAFGLTLGTTVLGIIFALWRGSETLAVVAAIGGFAAPLWLQGKAADGSPLNFFGYLAALNAGLLGVAAWRQWRIQAAVCLIATTALLWGWSLTRYQPEFRLLTLGFLTLYYALFTAAYLLPDLLRRRPLDHGNLAQFIVASLLYLPAGYALSREAWGNFPGAFPALAGVVYLLASWQRQRAQDMPAAATFFTLGFVCALGAIAVQFQSHIQVVLYSMVAAGLLIASLRYSHRLLYGFGALLALLATTTLWWVLTEPSRARLVILNEHGVAWLAWLLACGATLHALQRDLQAAADSPLDSVFPRSVLAYVGAFGFVVGLGWFSAEQTLYAFTLLGRQNAPLAHLLVSLEWTLIGAGLLIGGVQSGIRALRLMGLGMLALTTCKLFLYDLGFLVMPYRALSFAGLGLALIGVAWLYGRFGKTEATA